jgi:sugar/nucleoside kinase (ribokinase family)
MDLNPSKTIVCYGDLVTDLVMQIPHLPIYPYQTQVASAFTIEAGGAGNVLITAARLGGRCLALGALGEDANGRAVRDILAQEGVDLSYAQGGAGSANVAVLVFVDSAGQHVFIAHDGTGPAFALDERARGAIGGGGAFILPGYALAEQRMASAAREALQLAVDAGVPVFSDLGPIVAEAGVREAAEYAVSRSTVSVLTADEAQRFTGCDDVRVAAETLLRMGSRSVVIKRGGEGCAVFDHEDIYHVPGLKVDVRDTTGAGDAFLGGLVVDWLEHRDLVRAAIFANRVGAAKVQKIGSGRQCPTAAEVARMVDLVQETRVQS